MLAYLEVNAKDIHFCLFVCLSGFLFVCLFCLFVCLFVCLLFFSPGAPLKLNYSIATLF